MFFPMNFTVSEGKRKEWKEGKRQDKVREGDRKRQKEWGEGRGKKWEAIPSFLLK